MRTQDAREEFHRQMRHKHWLDMAQKATLVLLTVVCFLMLCAVAYLYILN